MAANHGNPKAKTRVITSAAPPRAYDSAASVGTRHHFNAAIHVPSPAAAKALLGPSTGSGRQIAREAEVGEGQQDGVLVGGGEAPLVEQGQQALAEGNRVALRVPRSSHARPRWLIQPSPD
jgi:hypothetical protein